MKRIKIGEFVVNSGQIKVSDPCYVSDECNTDFKAVDGKYNAYVVLNKVGRVGMLVAIHTNYDCDNENFIWEEADFVGVDSGTMSICDLAYYDKYHKSELDNNWYSHFICEELDEYMILENAGCVSSSGYGDGSYPVDVVYESEDSDKICAVRVQFLEVEGNWNK